ncbi:MAG: extensin family protein, partial [Alphaproteobacteria bacterium]|nr:extensin family protein [Alphaproteobacteria bacterium]
YYGGNGASRDTPTEPRPLGLPRPTPGTPLRQFAAMPRFKPHAPHVRNNESACVGAGIVQPTRFIRPRQPVGSGACHIEQPFMMHAAADGDVRFEPAATLRCQMVPSIETWVDKVLRPAARRYFGSDIARLKIAASYSCRTRNSQFGASLSEHGKGNAIDISMFYLENGEVISVKSGWHGSEAERRFLRYVHRGACEHFSTVLGPNADRYHHDHFHLDLARHGRRGDYRVCR